jgi:hypothetical protein
MREGVVGYLWNMYDRCYDNYVATLPDQKELHIDVSVKGSRRVLWL